MCIFGSGHLGLNIILLVLRSCGTFVTELLASPRNSKEMCLSKSGEGEQIHDENKGSAAKKEDKRHES